MRLKDALKSFLKFFSNEEVHYVILCNAAFVKRERKDLLFSNFLGDSDIWGPLSMDSKDRVNGEMP